MNDWVKKMSFIITVVRRQPRLSRLAPVTPPQFDNGILEIWNNYRDRCIIATTWRQKSLNITDIFYYCTWGDSTHKEINGLF